MYISKFRLYNYKCFQDSGEIELTPGMNIIVGQNNSGKTALLEALSLSITNKPHKSIYLSSNSKQSDVYKLLKELFSELSEN